MRGRRVHRFYPGPVSFPSLELPGVDFATDWFVHGEVIMKGFSHFISGVAAASCVPGVVAEAALGYPAPLILSGVAALL